VCLVGLCHSWHRRYRDTRVKARAQLARLELSQVLHTTHCSASSGSQINSPLPRHDEVEVSLSPRSQQRFEAALRPLRQIMSLTVVQAGKLTVGHPNFRVVRFLRGSREHLGFRYEGFPLLWLPLPLPIPPRIQQDTHFLHTSTVTPATRKQHRMHGTVSCHTPNESRSHRADAEAYPELCQHQRSLRLAHRVDSSHADPSPST
jgi:hypothetical protein